MTSPHFFAKTTVILQSSTNPIDNNINQIDIFFAYKGFTPTFVTNQVVNLSMQNFSVSFYGVSSIVLSGNQNNVLSGDLNITQLL